MRSADRNRPEATLDLLATLAHRLMLTLVSAAAGSASAPRTLREKAAMNERAFERTRCPGVCGQRKRKPGSKDGLRTACDASAPTDAVWPFDESETYAQGMAHSTYCEPDLDKRCRRVGRAGASDRPSVSRLLCKWKSAPARD